MKQILLSTFIIFIAFFLGNTLVKAQKIQYERSASVYFRHKLDNNYENAINVQIKNLFSELDIFKTPIANNSLFADYEIVSSKGTSSISYNSDDNLIIKGESRSVIELDSKKNDMQLGDFLLNVLDKDIEDSYKASYGIYKNDKLVYRFDINNNGLYKTELPCGYYIVKQLDISPLYLKDNKKYSVKIKENKETILEISNRLRNEKADEIDSEMIEISVPNTFSNTNAFILLRKNVYVKKKDWL